MTGAVNTPDGSPDLVAHTNGRDLEQLLPSSGSYRNIPNELLEMIFQPLEKVDLKSVRSTCKLFALLVSPRLFDKIFISPHHQNVDVFCQITEHPDLHQYPHELVYDIQEFRQDIDLSQYSQYLCDQLGPPLARHLGSIIDDAEITHHVDNELESFIHMVKKNPPGSDCYSTCRVVQRGFQIYQEKVKEQNYYNTTGKLLACLCVGLTKLTCLEKVDFQSTWDNWCLHSVDWSENLHHLRMNPGPLARAWSPFHLMPKAPFYETTAKQLDNVMRALSSAGRPLRVLDAGTSICVPYEAFHPSSRLSHAFRQHGLAATNGLESLTLRISIRSYAAEVGLFQLHLEMDDFEDRNPHSVALLATALRHMPRLRYLSLSSSGSWNESQPRMSFTEIFQNVRLPALERLVLAGMLGSAANILAFLRAQPQLCDLKLSEIDLSEGTWADLFDDMRKWLHLGSVGMYHPLRQVAAAEDISEDDDFWNGVAPGDMMDTWEDEPFTFDMTEHIGNYLLHGGYNPLRDPE